MINDPELKAMSEVYEALQGLNVETQKRVVDWVLSKLSSGTTTSKRGPKPGNKRGPKPKSRRGRPPASKKSKVSLVVPAEAKQRRGRPRKAQKA